MPAAPSPLSLLVPLLLAALVGTGAAGEKCSYPRETCQQVVCKYPGSYISPDCNRCYPGLCKEVAPTQTPTLSKLVVAPPEPKNASTFANSSGRTFSTTPAPGYVTVSPPAPPRGCTDQYGQPREPLSSWVDDLTYPCLLYKCPKEGGHYTVEDLSIGCADEPTDLGDCTATRNPGQCCFNYTCHSGFSDELISCIDMTGQLRKPSEVWNDDDLHTCVTYVCSNGTVKVIKDLRPLCRPIPEAHCVPYRAPKDCCYAFNCTVTSGQQLCVDSSGSYRREGDYWYDDITHPCVKFVCRNGVTETEEDKRDSCPTPPPKPGCQATRASGDCCFTFRCGCIYNGELKQDGEEFPDNPLYPCAKLRCEEGVVVTVTQTSCPLLACTNQVRPPLQCCKQCASCIFGGVEYQEGDDWFDDLVRPCLQYRCDNGQAVMVHNVSATCMDAPYPSCSPWLMKGICCPKWDCEEQPCTHLGVQHDHGTTWPSDPQKPCKHLICNNTAVEVLYLEPPCEGAPYPHCTKREVPFQCCPDWDCVTTTCRYGSDPVQVYTENQKWYDDDDYPCKQYTCTKTGVLKTQDLTSRCEDLDPPDCHTERPLGHCCKRCIPPPPQCVDRNGGLHDPNELYFEDPDTQCVFVRCLQNTTVTIYDRRANCGRDPRITNPRCSQVATENCCPVYHCPDCEYHGHLYRKGEKWWDRDDRQCTRYLCGYDGTHTTVYTRLPCPEVRAGCVPNYRGNECCHYKYTCMFDPQHNLIPMPPPGGRDFELP